MQMPNEANETNTNNNDAVKKDENPSTTNKSVTKNHPTATTTSKAAFMSTPTLPHPTPTSRRKRYKVQAVKRYRRPTSEIHKEYLLHCMEHEHLSNSTQLNPLAQSSSSSRASNPREVIIEETPNKSLPQSIPPLNGTANEQSKTLSKHPLQDPNSIPNQDQILSSVTNKRRRSTYQPTMDIESKYGVVEILPHTKNDSTEQETNVYPLEGGVTSIVGYAARMVAEELERGSWDEAYVENILMKGWKQSRSIKAKKKRARHLIMAAASIRKFAHDIVAPALIASRKSETCSTKLDKSSPGHRMFVATLLALRELMIMNANKLFTGSHETKEDEKKDSIGAKQGEEERVFRLRLLCTTLICKSIVMNDVHVAKEIIKSFRSALRSYDGAEEEFSSCLTPAENLSSSLLNGHELKKMEELSWRTSYNCARSNHPLVQLRKDRDILKACKDRAPQVTSLNQIRDPSPNMCFIPMIEKVQFESDWSDYSELMKDDMPDEAVLKLYRRQFKSIRMEHRKRDRAESTFRHAMKSADIR